MTMWWAGFLEDVDDKETVILGRMRRFWLDPVKHPGVQVDEAPRWQFEPPCLKCSSGLLVEVAIEKPFGCRIFCR